MSLSLEQHRQEQHWEMLQSQAFSVIKLFKFPETPKSSFWDGRKLYQKECENVMAIKNALLGNIQRSTKV